MTKRKIRTIVCGSTFGQFYIEALKNLHEEFEIVGLLANGSNRSQKCARYYGIDLYKNIDEIPKDIDLACIVLRSGVLGGKGSYISMKLLEKGINVIQEQPIHNKDMVNCFRMASEKNVVFKTGDLYVHLPTVRQFIKCSKAMKNIQKPMYIDGAFASQVSYPMIHILMETLPSIRQLKINEVNKNGGPFQVMTGKIGDIPFIFRVHNEVNPDDPDNYMHLLHRIEIGCEGGSLALTDTHGPLVWHPRLHVPKNSITVKDFSNMEFQELFENSTEVLGNYHKQSYSEILTKEWPKAIGKDLIDMRNLILNKSDRNVNAQRELLCSSQWHIITEKLGYPELKLGCNPQMLSVDIFKNAILEDDDLTNNIYKNNLYEDEINIKSFIEFSNNEIKIIDKKIVQAYIESLEKAVLKSMVYTLQNSGVLINKKEKYVYDKIINSLNAAKQHHILIKRWLELLVDHKYIACEKNEYYGTDFVSKEELDNEWEKLSEIWQSGMGSKKTIDYFIKNVEQLPQLITGEQQAVFLLFPEGKIDCAYSMYHDMVTVQYLNNLVGEFITRIGLLKNNLEGRKTFKIIEVGAGTGATTDIVIQKLKKLDNTLEIEYLFSDLSNYFLSAANRKFTDVSWMNFKLIDIDKNFITQGLEKEGADIIIAAGVINNAADTDGTVENLMDLLVPGGWLIMTEAIQECMEMLISQAFMMTNPEDDRKNTKTTFMSIEQWKDVFDNVNAEEVIVLPEKNHILYPLGQRFFAVKKQK